MINPLTGGLYFKENNRKNPTEKQDNNLNSLYKPVTSWLTYEEKLRIIKSVGEECIMPEELS